MKLYVIVRADLPPGLQIAQSIHAARQFAADHQAVEQEWFRKSNTVAVLSVPDETALRKLKTKAEMKGVQYSEFREPDLSDSMTAMALAPTDAARRLCRALPLALA